MDTLRAKSGGSGAGGLGKAINGLKPDANTKSDLREASRQTKEDLHGSG